MGCSPSVPTITQSRSGSGKKRKTRREADADGSLNEQDVHQEGDNNSIDGKMRLGTSRMSILLVFGKEDVQCDAMRKAADKGGYKATVAKSSDLALKSYQEHQQDVVIVDCRDTRYFDYEKLCRKMKALHPQAHSRFIAITSKCEKDEPSIAPLLNAGFNKRVVENANITSCYNELLTIEKGELELRTHQHMQTYTAMCHALQLVAESIEITDTKFNTEFVNSAWEKQTGYTSGEVVGMGIQEALQVNNCNEDDTIFHHAKRDQVWEGEQSLRRKNGDVIRCKCRVVPVESSQEIMGRYIIVRLPAGYPDMDPRSYISIYTHIINARRKDSITKNHQAIYYPITKVINMLYEAQDNSGSVNAVHAVQAIEKVLDILQTADLFSPRMRLVKEEDPLTSDYVDGLCDRPSISSSRPLLTSKQSQSSITRPAGAKLLTSTYHSSPEIQQLLESNAAWNFDILRLESLTNKNTLVPLGMKIFERFGALEFLGVDERVMANWLELITANYKQQNTYHNATHAADVLQATAYFLDKMRPKELLDAQDEIAALIAAVIHDVDHPAKSSSFLVNTRDELALLYNDIAVLENHHAATGFKLTQEFEKSNILKNLSREAYESLRHSVIDMVLATEMAKHFEHLQKFIHLCAANLKPTSEDELEDAEVMTTSSQDYVVDLQENRKQILRMVIKCADVSNPARETHLMTVWAERIAEEYFQQTDLERSKNLPVVMPHFDRRTCSIPQSQYKFMEVFLLNMFEHWDAFLDIPEITDQLQKNYQYWKDKDEEETKQVEATSEST